MTRVSDTVTETGTASLMGTTGVSGQLVGETPIKLEAVQQDSTGEPMDPDGDGLYEDVDGNGQVTYDDVVTLFEDFDELDTDDLRDQFDFNQNDKLDFDDIVTFFEEEQFNGGSTGSPTGGYAWLGVAPDDIDGDTNPTLSLTVGQDYTIEWTNQTGEAHNFVIVDADGNELVSTDSMSQEGGTQTVEFTASDAMDAYYSSSHTTDMRGSIEIASDDGEGVVWHRDLEVPTNAEEATNWDNYEITKILDQPNFMDIEIAPDGRLFYITRGKGSTGTGGGLNAMFEVGYVNPSTQERVVVFEHETFTATSGTDEIDTPTRETGGQGIALDPNFEENGHIYINHHPRLDEMDDIGPSPYDEFWDGEVQHFGYMLVSRFTLDGDAIDPESEVEIIRIPQQYDSCCHHGACIEFGPNENLWVSVGDNSEIVSPYSSIDDRESRHPAYDAARTAGNTADLRGSILRVTPEPDGGYSVPSGNFKEIYEERVGEEFDEEVFRPEIFSMGYRNPYVFSVDDHTGALFTADYAPGFGSWANPPERGPPGIAGYRLNCEPTFAGWPFFKGYYPYRRYDHDTGEVGQPYWIDNPRNDSRNNTGLTRLPKFVPDLIWQPQNGQANPDDYVPPAWADMPRPGEVTWPKLGGSGGNNAGPSYRYSEEYTETALPPFFEGKQFAISSYASISTVWYIALHEDGSLDIDEFLPDAPWVGGTPHHMEIGPGGRAFVTNYGDGFYMVEYTGPTPEYQPPPEEEQPERVEPSSDGLGGEPPEDATILWNGDTATLATDWEAVNDGGEVEWNETADYFETVPSAANIQPTDELADVHLHLEWRAPEGSDGEQPWANSGLFMMQRYEFQILDDYNDPSAAAPSGSYYSQQPGIVHAVRPPGEWNEYDLLWRGPRWEDGELVRPAQATLFFNGVAVLVHLNIDGPNTPGYEGSYQEHATALPFVLQAYDPVSTPIQFRNVWYRSLPEEETYESTASGEHPETLYGSDQYTISPGEMGEPPSDADVLIDGDLSAWKDPDGSTPDWTEADGYVEVEPGAGDIQTKEAYGDAQLHLEYRIPEDVDGEGPWRGASGVLMMGRYEINIVDTWDNPVEADRWAGAYTHQGPPHFNSVRQPGEWQQLDLVWEAPRFEGNELAQPARVTAFLNGVAVQTRLEVNGPNAGFTVWDYAKHSKRPLRLQESGDEIQFRNTWIRPFGTGDLIDDAPPEALSLPYAVDFGGSLTEGNVTIDGLEFDRSPSDNPNISVTGDGEYSSTSNIDSLPDPEELEYEGTDNDLLYASEVNGEAFGIAANVPNGSYDVTLHFSEWPYFSDDQVPRLQNVSIEGEQVLERYELLRGEAQVETFEDVEVSDGELNIDLEVHPDSVDPYAKLNGLEIRRDNEVSLPYALNAGGSEIEGDVTIDGLTFDESPDDNPNVSTSGGQGVGAASNPTELEYEGTDHDLLYASERYGEQFSYSIGIENGSYDVTLHFSEWPYFSDDQVPRLQNVSVEGEQVLERYELLRGQAQVETFEGVEVSDGELNIDLEVHPDSVDPYAKLNGLEIREAGSSGPSSIEPGTAIELEGQTSGWIGISPDVVDGTENPTLNLAEGETYNLGWTTGDGSGHNIEIHDADGNVVSNLETEVTTDPGEGQWVGEFEASSEMTRYVCDPHQGLMSGDINIL